MFSEEFTKDLYFIRKTVLSSTRVKEYKGVFFNANMFISFVSSFLDDLRDGRKLDVSRAFSIVLDNEFISEYNGCVQLYFDNLNEQF